MTDKRSTIFRSLHVADPSDTAIREHLETILRSRSFCSAPSLGRFLGHLVLQTIAGNENQLKEYSIGVEVFERGEQFDPRIDTIVRVQARRLRAKLDDYYHDEGSADPIRIEVPKGQYVAVFHQVRAAHPGPTPFDSGARPLAIELSSQPVPIPLFPAARTPLVGRNEEMAAIRTMLLAEEIRLVSLTGVGGSGKTRLALEVASALSGFFPGGLWFVPFASITDPGVVPVTIAQALGVRSAAGMPIANALRDFIRHGLRDPALLVVDNLEHLLGSAPLLGELLDASGYLKILATSREALRLYGEYDFGVAPLPTIGLTPSASAAQICGNPAVELFAQRAKAVNPGFHLNEHNIHSVAEICLRLDGLPLAIELAAARTRILPPADILARLEHRLDLLADGPRDAHARQQTLRGAVDWSYALLSPSEQKLFRRLAVFAGGCTLESAEAVCNARQDLGADILQWVSSLVDKSLLNPSGSTREPARFTMLETIREYAMERLIDCGEDASTRKAHAAYALVIAEEQIGQIGASADSGWADLCDSELDNLRAALNWLIETDQGEWAMRLGSSLYYFWEARDHLSEGRNGLQKILSMKSASAPSTRRAHVAFCAASLMAAQRDYSAALRIFQHARDIYAELGDQRGVASMLSAMGANRRLCGDFEPGRAWAQEALSIYRSLNDAHGMAGTLSNLADVLNAQGDHQSAQTALGEAISIFRELGEAAGVAWSLNRMGDVALCRDDLPEARRLYTEGAGIFRASGDQWGLARSCADLGYLACRQGQHNEAHGLFVQAMQTMQSLSHTRGIAKVLEGFAYLAVDEGDSCRALVLAGAAASLRGVLASAPRPDEEAMLRPKLEQARAQIDPNRAENLRHFGSGMSLREATRYALGETHLPTALLSPASV